jgi:hypothetical protein
MLAGAGLLVLALATRFVVFVFAAFLLGMAAAPAFMVTERLLQQATTPGLRGRVFSTRDFLMRSVLLVGVSLAGWIAFELGAQPALLVCGSWVAGTGVLVFVWALCVPAPPDPSGARIGAE